MLFYSYILELHLIGTYSKYSCRMLEEQTFVIKSVMISPHPKPLRFQKERNNSPWETWGVDMTNSDDGYPLVNYHSNGKLP